MFCGVAILFNGAPCGFLGEQEAVIKPKSTKGHVTFSAILSYRQVVFVFRYHIVVLRCNQTQIMNQRSCHSHYPFILAFSIIILALFSIIIESPSFCPHIFIIIMSSSTIVFRCHFIVFLIMQKSQFTKQSKISEHFHILKI